MLVNKLEIPSSSWAKGARMPEHVLQWYVTTKIRNETRINSIQFVNAESCTLCTVPVSRTYSVDRTFIYTVVKTWNELLDSVFGVINDEGCRSFKSRVNRHLLASWFMQLSTLSCCPEIRRGLVPPKFFSRPFGPQFGHSKKLQFYSLFKHDYKISSYLDLIRNSANRKDLVKIRISNHKLMIETGRYNQTSRNDRFCPICNSGIIEDEFHFLFHCPKYSIPREKFYNQIQQTFVDFNQLSYTELV